MPEFDLTRQDAAPLDLVGRLPLPIGKPLQIKPSPGERTVLEAFGWEDGQPIPDNFAELLAQVQATVDPQQLPPPVPLDTPPLEMPAETPFDSLPPARQAEIRAAMKQVFQQTAVKAQQQEEASQLAASGLDPSLQQAIQLAGEVGSETLVENDLPARPRPPATPAPAPAPARAPEPEPEPPPALPRACPNCQWQLDDEPLEVTEEDKTQFLEAILALQPFYKQYSLFGGQVKLVLRTLTTGELETCLLRSLQLAKAQTPEDAALAAYRQTDLLHYLRTALQLVSLDGPQGLRVHLPRSLADWQRLQHLDDPHAVWQFYTQQLCVPESLQRVISKKVHHINEIARRLEENSQNPDFWPAVAPTA